VESAGNPFAVTPANPPLILSDKQRLVIDPGRAAGLVDHTVVKIENASREAEERRQALLRRYSDEDLHRLRVCLRRMRSFLKQRRGSHAQLLRHRLGELADATNAARDWDTLLLRARDELGPMQYTLLEHRLYARCKDTQEQALKMLTSHRWTQVLKDWERYLRRHRPAPAAGNQKPVRTTECVDAVERAWQRVQAVGSDRNWHRLRIAVKELRYHLESVAMTKRDHEAEKVLRRCKRLQEDLGAWHDTAVHRQLVLELALEFRPDTEQKALKLIHRWCARMERQGKHFLQSARAELATENWLAGLGRPAPPEA